LLRRDESIDDDFLPLVHWTMDAANNESVVRLTNSIQVNPDPRLVEDNPLHANPDLRFDTPIQVNHELRFDPLPNPPAFQQQQQHQQQQHQYQQQHQQQQQQQQHHQQHQYQQQKSQDEEPKYARVDLRNKRSSKNADSREGTPVRYRRRG
jgi:hypothetical protein